MADLEKSPIIQFRTDDSGVMKTVSSVKELKTAISQLKDSIVEMRQSGQDTTKEVTQLQAAQRELNTVMGLTKKGVDGVEGSYDRLVAQLREAKQEWRALPKFIDGELNPAWEEARKRCEELNSTLKDYDEGVGVFTRNVGNYKSALEGWTGTLGNVAQVGGQMNNGLTQMANLMGIVGADTSGLNNGMKALQITIGRINGARGLLGFIKNLGNASKAEKTETITTKANTTAHATNTVAKGAETTATWTLKGAIDALKASLTGGVSLIVGAVFTAISGLITWLVGAKDATEDLNTSIIDSIDYIDALKTKMSELSSEDSHKIALMRARGATEEEIHNQTIQNLEDEKKRQNDLEEKTKKRITTNENLLEVLDKQSEAYKIASAELEKDKKTRDEAVAKQKELNTEIRRQNELYEAQKEGNAKKDAASAAQAAAQKAQKDREAQAQAIAAAEAAAQKKIADTIEKVQAEIDKTLPKSQQLTKEYEKIKTEWTAIRDQAGMTQDNIDKINVGLQALADRYVPQIAEAEFEEKSAEVAKNIENAWGSQVKYEDSLKKVIGLTDEQLAQVGFMNAGEAKRLETLKAELGIIRQNLSAFTDEQIIEFKAMSQDDLRKKLGEPTATWLKLYFQKEFEKDTTYDEIFARVLTCYENSISTALQNGMFGKAHGLMESLIGQFWEELKGKYGSKAALDYIDSLEKTIAQALRESPLPQGFNWVEKLFPQSEIDTLQITLDGLREKIKSLTGDELISAETDAARVEADLLTARLKRFTAFFEEIQKVTEAYGKSSANVVNNTAELWNTLIDIRQKDIDKQKDQGKISEKEWNKQTERNKKSFEGVKALQIGTAVVNTAAAIVQALADTTVPSYYVKAANAVAAGIAGAAEIAKIASTEYGTQPTTPQAPQITQAPQIVNSYGLNAQDYAEAAAANPVKVYVLESDITEAQNTSKVRVEESTF